MRHTDTIVISCTNTIFALIRVVVGVPVEAERAEPSRAEQRRWSEERMLTFGLHEITTAMKCAALASTEGNRRKFLTIIVPIGQVVSDWVSTVTWRSTSVCRFEYVSTVRQQM